MQTGEWSYVAAIASRDLKKGLVWTDAQENPCLDEAPQGVTYPRLC
jgi:hypothetical protein